MNKKELPPAQKTLLESVPMLLRVQNEEGRKLIEGAFQEYQDKLTVNIVKALVEDWEANKYSPVNEEMRRNIEYLEKGLQHANTREVELLGFLSATDENVIRLRNLLKIKDIKVDTYKDGIKKLEEKVEDLQQRISDGIGRENEALEREIDYADKCKQMRIGIKKIYDFAVTVLKLHERTVEVYNVAYDFLDKITKTFPLVVEIDENGDVKEKKL